MARSKGPGPSQSDLAAALGLSVSTVSRALSNAPGISEEVRRRVVQAAAQFGYRSGSSGLSGAFDRITVVTALFDVNGLLSWVYQEMLEGVYFAARGAGLPVESHMTTTTKIDRHGIEARLDSRSALICMGWEPDAETVAWLSEREVAAVIVNGVDPRLEIDSVSPANFFGGRMIAEHLVALGHRRIGFIGGSQRWTLMRRFHGFRSSLADAFGEENLDLPTLSLHANSPQREREILVEWLETHLDDVTALFCFNDLIAISAIEAVQSLGKSVPEDISIVGFDDLPMGQMSTPKLTTFRVDWRAIGAEALRCLARRRQQSDMAARQVQIGGKLMPRESSAPVRK